MEFEDVLEEYLYHCMARGYTRKTMINKCQEYKQLKMHLKEKRPYLTFDPKQQEGQKLVSTYKCEKEEYLNEDLKSKVVTPKVPKRVLNGFTVEKVQGMIEAFSCKTYIESKEQGNGCHVS